MDWSALFTPSLIWAKATWVSPFCKTYRHRLSGTLSFAAGGLMFAAVRLDEPGFPDLLGAAALILAAMFATLFCPPRLLARHAVRARGGGRSGRGNIR